MPIFCGMLLANQFAEATFVDVHLQAEKNATAYVAKTSGPGDRLQTALFETDEKQAASLRIEGDKPLREASTWHLQAPALDATIGVTFGEAVVSPDAARQPRAEILGVKNGRTVIHLAAVTAALVFLE